MKCNRLKKTAREPDAKDDLSFPPPYSKQPKYLFLADKFLSKNNGHRKVVAIDSHKQFKRVKEDKGKRAA